MADLDLSSVRLPSAFQECEWILSGTTSAGNGPFINTLKIPKATSKISITFKFKTNSIYMFLFGGHKGDDGVSLYLGNTLTSPNATLSGVGTYFIPYETENINNIIYDVKNGKIIHNGTTVLSGTSAAFGSGTDYPIRLFRLNRATNPNWASGYIYAYQYYEDDVLLQNFVPCYLKTAWNGIPAGTIGLYDLCGSLSANETPFYTNEGTGEFTKGPDVVHADGITINGKDVAALTDSHGIVWKTPGDVFVASLGNNATGDGTALHLSLENNKILLRANT